MLKLLATTAVLLFLTTQCVDSAVTALTEIIGDTDVILKVGCNTNWWTGSELLVTTGTAVAHHKHATS